MSSSTPLDLELDILGQQPSLNIFTGITFIYANPRNNITDEAVETLSRGLARLGSAFPWTKGQVVNQGKGKGNSGRFSIRPSGDPVLEHAALFTFEDLRDQATAPTIERLRDNGFPITMLDEKLLCPVTTFNEVPKSTVPTGEIPVFAIQVTMMNGVFVLSFVAQHQTMDMIGQAHMIRLLSKACHGPVFLMQEELSTGNMSRRDITPLLDESSLTVPESQTEPMDANMDNPDPPSSSKWADFAFSSEFLQTIKDIATSELASGFVSTDDALTAFIWQAIARVRTRRFSRGTEMKLGRAVNTRPYLRVPQTYPGMMQHIAYSSLPMQDLVKLPLSVIASMLRTAIDPETSGIENQVRAQATRFSRMADKTHANFAAGNVRSRDLLLSSWAKADLYGCDFNLGLGKPLAIRRPLFPPVEGLAYFMPRSPTGEIVFTVCLSVDDLELLKMHGDFVKMAKFLG